jgi:hypothetical protein
VLAKHCTGLQEINFAHCDAITDGAIEALAKRAVALGSLDAAGVQLTVLESGEGGADRLTAH